MGNVLSPRQVEAVKRHMSGSARPEDVEQLRDVTPDDLDAHADHLEQLLALHKALRDACQETRKLVEDNGVVTAGDLRSLGIAIPAYEVAGMILRAYAEGEISDDELRRLGLGEVDGDCVVAVSPLRHVLNSTGQG